MFTCLGSTRRRWRSPTRPTSTKACHRGGCDKASLARSTGLRCTTGSGSRHTSSDPVVAGRSASSRTPSLKRNDPARQGFLPALKDGVSALDDR
jgi:hypothetical protein